MKTIILSAGQGTRLLPLTATSPKCLLEVADDVTLLGWQLMQLAKAGISEVVVVTGYGAKHVDEEIKKFSDIINVRTLLNPDFDKMDNLGSAWKARDEMNEDFIILNGDTLFTAPVVERLCAAEPAPLRTTISRKESFDDDDMKVILEGDRLTAISKKLEGDAINAESIGMILFRNEGVDLFRDGACEAMSGRKPGENLYYLSLIDTIARAHRVDINEAAQDEWGEVDFLEDLEAAREKVQGWIAKGANS